MVHGDGAHPPEGGVGGVGALLEDGRVAAGEAEFIPAHPGGAARGDRLVKHQ